MSDAALAFVWLAVLAAGLGAAILLARAGVARTYVRDLIHIGAGVWVFGWPLWHSPAAPVLITLGALLLVLSLPLLRRRARVADRLMGALAGDDETWTGIVLYVLAFAALTPAGLLGAPFPAAAALLALAWGDGLGGLVGRRFGRHRLAVPWAKPKTWEGALTVAAAGAAAALVSALYFGAARAPTSFFVLGLAAAAAELLAPRASDNVLVPAAVVTLAWILA